jgi:hypothetical protein
MTNRVGNDQLKAIFENKDRLAQEIADWRKRKELIERRELPWKHLTALLAHAASLPVALGVQAEVKAIEEHHRLLDHPDPVPGITNTVTEALRKALNDAHTACTTAHTSGMKALEAQAAWQQLAPGQRLGILSEYGIEQVPSIYVGTADEMLATLETTKLSELHAICDALPTRFGNALAAATKLLEPQAQQISLPACTIKNEAELQAWLRTVEAEIRAKLQTGPVIV